jgi:DNA-binding LytR/AlgR family response regulator
MSEQQNLYICFDRVKLGIKVRSGWIFYMYDEIITILSDLRYSIINTSDLKIHYIDIPLKTFDGKLPLIFFKFRRSGIVNLAYMKSFLIEENQLKIHMLNNSIYTISRYLKNDFYLRINNLNRMSLPCERCKSCTKRETCNDLKDFIK